jgi:negative regulator of sigma-B (phosphoserine phosphatase)
VNLQLAHESRPCSGECANGDTTVVRENGAWALLAVVDALGHGPRAEEVAVTAAESLLRLPEGTGAREAVDILHLDLKATRGAAAMVCVLKNSLLEGCGVGNVLLRVQGARIPVTLTPGVLGRRLRRTRPFFGKAPPGSRLVLASDGISQRFRFTDQRALSPHELCRHLMTTYGKFHDDATVLVADVEDPHV